MAKVSTESAHTFLTRAEQYLTAADLLCDKAENVTQVNEPIYFLYFHTLELLLKSFIRLHKSEVEYGHDLKTYYDQCRCYNLVVSEEDRTDLANIVGLLNSANERHGFRYFDKLTISRARSDLKWTGESIGRLIQVVAQAVKASGESPSASGIPAYLRIILGKPTKKD
jgi:hypothetical protein